METVNRNIHALLNSIQKCQVYKDFKKQEAILNKNPELAQRVQHFRAENFKLQNEGDPENILAKAEQLARESEELRSFPEVNAYLDAELAGNKIGVHPNDNTATVWMETDDLIKLIQNNGNEVHVVNI